MPEFLFTNKQRWQTISVGLLVAISLFMFFVEPPANRRTYKMIMPGSYQILLKKGSYHLFNFSEWPSKNLNGKLQNLQLKIVEVKTNHQISSAGAYTEECRQVGWPLGRNRGYEETFFLIERTGFYKVSSKMRGVAALVPVELVYDTWFGASEFRGATNDQDFVEP